MVSHKDSLVVNNMIFVQLTTCYAISWHFEKIVKLSKIIKLLCYMYVTWQNIKNMTTVQLLTKWDYDILSKTVELLQSTLYLTQASKIRYLSWYTAWSKFQSGSSAVCSPLFYTKKGCNCILYIFIAKLQCKFELNFFF